MPFRAPRWPDKSRWMVQNGPRWPRIQTASSLAEDSADTQVEAVHTDLAQALELHDIKMKDNLGN